MRDPIRSIYGVIKVGSVVLLKEDNCPRLNWSLRVREEFKEGRGGVYCTFMVTTKMSVSVRTILRIHCLKTQGQPPNVSRSGRLHQKV